MLNIASMSKLISTALYLKLVVTKFVLDDSQTKAYNYVIVSVFNFNIFNHE